MQPKHGETQRKAYSEHITGYFAACASSRANLYNSRQTDERRGCPMSGLFTARVRPEKQPVRAIGGSAHGSHPPLAAGRARGSGRGARRRRGGMRAAPAGTAAGGSGQQQKPRGGGKALPFGGETSHRELPTPRRGASPRRPGSRLAAPGAGAGAAPLFSAARSATPGRAGRSRGAALSPPSTCTRGLPAGVGAGREPAGHYLSS